MRSTDIPVKLQQAFANSGLRNSIPQTTVTSGKASYAAGFPPETMQPEVSGGIPPDGKDLNGILFSTSASSVWAGAGGLYPFDATYAAEIGGYPQGAVVLMADLGGLWISTQEDNSNNPESSSTGWSPLPRLGIYAPTLSNSNHTLTPTEYSKPVTVASGALTANVQLSYPAKDGSTWVIVNNTTGAFTLTVKVDGGTGFQVPQGRAAIAYSNGTVLTQLLPQPATQTQVNALTESYSYVTPVTLGFGFSAVFGTVGGIKFPSWLGSLVINWGRSVSSVSEGGYSMAFAIPFASSCYALVPTVINNSSSGTQDVWAQWDQSHTTNGTAAIRVQWDGQPNNNADGWAFIAVGK